MEKVKAHQIPASTLTSGKLIAPNAEKSWLSCIQLMTELFKAAEKTRKIRGKSAEVF